MTDPLSIPVDSSGEVVDFGDIGEKGRRQTSVEKVVSEDRQPAAVPKKAPRGTAALERLLPDTARVRFDKVRQDGKIAIVGREYSTEEVVLAGGIKALIEKYLLPKYGGGEYIPVLIGKDGSEQARNSIIFEDPEPAKPSTPDPDRLVSTIFDKLEAQREAEERRQRERDEERRRYEEMQRKRNEEFQKLLETIAMRQSDSSSSTTNMMLMMMMMRQMSDSQMYMMRILEDRRKDEPPRLTKEDIASLVREEVRKSRSVAELPELQGVPMLRGDDSDDRYQKLLETMLETIRSSQSERLTTRDVVDLLTHKSGDDPVDKLTKVAEFLRNLNPQSGSELSELRTMVVELTKMLATGRSSESEIERMATTMDKILSIADRFGGNREKSGVVDVILSILPVLTESEIGKAIATKIKASAAKDAIEARRAAGDLPPVSPQQPASSQPLVQPVPVPADGQQQPPGIPTVELLSTANTDEEHIGAFLSTVRVLLADDTWRPRIMKYLTTLQVSGKNGLGDAARGICDELISDGMITAEKAKHVVSLIETHKDDVWVAIGGSSPDSQGSSKASKRSGKASASEKGRQAESEP